MLEEKTQVERKEMSRKEGVKTSSSTSNLKTTPILLEQTFTEGSATNSPPLSGR